MKRRGRKKTTLTMGRGTRDRKGINRIWFLTKMLKKIVI